ncbi:MAG: hypothetical protein ACRC42_04295 [Mycoplasma sp.]
MENKAKSVSEKVLNGEDLNLTTEQKENAIKKEEYFRKLSGDFFKFKTTKSFKELCTFLIVGYDCLLSAYKDKPEIKGDIDFIIKFAFRDFFLLMLINMREKFDNDDFFKGIHREVYMSNNYVQLDQFERLVDYCKQIINNDTSK